MRRAVRGAILAFLLLGGLQVFAAPLQVGMAAPSFTQRKQDGRAVSLEDYRGKWVVLVFHLRDFTVDGTLQVQAFQKDLAKFEAAGAQVMALSGEGPEAHLAFAEQKQLTFPLLQDYGASVAESYDSVGHAGKKRTFERNVILIDPSGNVAAILKNVHPSTSSAQALEALAAAQARQAKK